MRVSHRAAIALKACAFAAVLGSVSAQPPGTRTPSVPKFPDLMAPEKSMAAPPLLNCPCSRQNADILTKRGENAALALESLYQQIDHFSQPAHRNLLWTRERNRQSDELMQASINAGQAQAPVHVPPGAAGPASAPPGATHSLASTNGGDCKIMISVQSPCLAEILKIHEEIHQRACKKFFDGKHSLFDFDYREKMYMLDYLNEHVEAYSAEIRAIGEQARYWVATRCTF